MPSSPDNHGVPDPVARRISVWGLAGLCAAGMIGISILLFPRWNSDAELSHGYFMPVLCIALLIDAYRRGPRTYCADGLHQRLLVICACVLGVGALVFAGLYALAFSSSHALVQLSTVFSFALFGSAVLLTLGSDRVRLFPCNWAAWSAIWLWVLCAPVPPGAYTRLTITLQLAVSKGVLFLLHLLGIPATRHGNIIELVNTSVGVEDACSGVRSLLSCIFAGFFFSAYLLRRPLHRAVLVISAAFLALAMNLLRSFSLTFLAHKGVNVAGAWHDWTGHGVLFITAVILGALAFGFERQAVGADSLHASDRENDARSMPVAPLWRIAAFLATIGATCVLFVVSEPKPPPQRGPAPDLAALIPDQFSGWKQVATDDLTPFQATLGTNTLIQRNYFRDTPRGRDQITIYVAYWAAGQSNPSQVALHTPDGCWPAAGWKRQQAPNNNIILRTQRHTLPEAEYRLFQNEQGQIQHVWYWHMYRGTTIQQLDPYKVSELLQMVLRFGLQAPSDQLFFRISSNREWKDISEEPLLQELFLRFRQFGL